MLGDPAHLRVPPAPVGKSFDLALEVARIDRSEPGRTSAIAFAAQSMTREAGVGGSRASAAERDKLAALGELVARPRFKLRAARKQGAGYQRDRTKERGHFPNGTGTTANRFPLAISMISAFAMCTAACKPPPDHRQSFPTADAGRGKRLIEEVGCATCHTIGGIDWPQGRAAPELRGLTGRALIAGKVPNSPENLAAFVRNAPAVAPGTTMPPMPLSEQDSRDVAAYLYEIGS
jgi:mono/diheme cytochrome c family protein